MSLSTPRPADLPGMRILMLVLISSLTGLLSEPDARSIYTELLQRATVRGADYEAAAFLVRDSDGRIRSVAWPPTGRTRSERFEGAVPPRRRVNVVLPGTGAVVPVAYASR